MPTHFAILAVDLGSGPGPGTQIFGKVYEMFQMPGFELAANNWRHFCSLSAQGTVNQEIFKKNCCFARDANSGPCID